MTKLGLDIDARLIGYSNAFTEEEGRRVMTELIEGDAGFTAVIAGNDLLALGCYTALDEHGLKCPHDISVTGFNDMRFVDKISPPLTTMRTGLSASSSLGGSL